MTEIRTNKAIELFEEKKSHGYDVIVIAGKDEGQVSLIAQQAKKNFLKDSYTEQLACKNISSAQLAQYDDYLLDEIHSPSIFTPKLVVKIQDPPKKIANVISKYLKSVNKSCLVIVQSPALPPGSPLRELAKKEQNIAYIPCYDDDTKDSIAIVKQKVRKNGKYIEEEAARLMADHIGANRIAGQAEIDKVILYCDDKKQITIDDVEQLISDVSPLKIEEFCDLVFMAKINASYQRLEKILYSGANENQIVSLVIRHVLMLQRLVMEMRKGLTAQMAVKQSKPKIFFRRQHNITQQCLIWRLEDIGFLMHLSARLQCDMRSNVQEPVILLGYFLLSVLRLANSRIAAKNYRF